MEKLKKIKLKEKKDLKKKVSVSEKKISAPKPIPIPMVSADTFGRYRILVGHYLNQGGGAGYALHISTTPPPPKDI